MCQISVINLKSARLNRLAFLLAGSIGSTTNDDGWGYGDSSGIYKSPNPMFLDTESGTKLREIKSNTPLLGHVRAASPMVPVCSQNSHPFLLKNIIFMHNGKLTPKVEKNFELEYEVKELDDKGKEITKKYKHSDSEIFFKHFLTKYSTGDNFVEKLKLAMDDFYGKFAMVFYIEKDIYVVRGKTADLHISYQLDSWKKDAQVIGFMVNTSKNTLLYTGELLSNLEQLDGRPGLCFTNPTLLKEETVYKVGKNDLEEIGEIKENISAYTPYQRGAGAGNFTQGGAGQNGKTTTTTGATEYTGENRLIRELWEFSGRYSLSIRDLSDLFMAAYGVSLLEIEPAILDHFFDKVVPIITRLSKKEERRLFKKILAGVSVSRTEYIDTGKEFPWMLWTPEQKSAFLKGRETPESLKS